MSFLSPLFLLGVFAIAGPIVFHLIRRATREKILFSSLMFLQPSPPRLTRKSRMEHWFLLMLRCLALILLALAFARPYFANDQQAQLEADEQVHHALLIDTSASMRREGLWEQTLEHAQHWLDQWAQDSMVHIFLFDESLQTLMTPEQWSTLGQDLRRAQCMNLLSATQLSWKATSLDVALIEAIDQMEETAREDSPQTQQASWELVVLSDMQQGTRYEALRGQDWPKHAFVVFDQVMAANVGNASIQILRSPWQLDPDEDTIAPRLRITSTSDATQDQFKLAWAEQNNTTETPSSSLPLYLPPGKARVMNGPIWDATQAADRLVLEGDVEPFDNLVWLAPYKPRENRVNLIDQPGRSDNQQELSYYIDRAFQSLPGHQIIIDHLDPSAAQRVEEAPSTDLWVINKAPTSSTARALLERCKQGEIILLPLKDQSMEEALQILWPEPAIRIQKAELRDFALLGKIDFQHPIFAPFADTRFNDFSKIHFWSHQLIEGIDLLDPSVSIPASFDNDSPALLIRQHGSGWLVILTSSWAPSDSQLALSTKFVPLLYTLMNQDQASGELMTQYSVGDIVDLGGLQEMSGLSIQDPAGTLHPVQGQRQFRQTQQPGLYRITHSGDFEWTFAVNLSPSESQTQPLPIEVLEGLGIPTRPLAANLSKANATREETIASKRLLQAREIEARQQFWKWSLCIVLGLLLLETCLAARTSHRAQT